MASKEVEVLDPTATVEKVKKIASGVVLNRRSFVAAIGVAAAAGTALVAGPTAMAQQPKPSGFKEVDILNFLLNVKYLKATLYSFITQGADLPTTFNGTLTNVLVGTGGVFNPVSKVTFTGTNAAQITDMFNEMYYDELSQLIALRNLIGSAAVIGRPTMDLLGSNNQTVKTAVTMTPVQAIAYSRLLEDLSSQAFIYASAYLSGSNRAYANQVAATDGFHAGAVRLVAIQNSIAYFPMEVTSQFAGSTTLGSPTLWAIFPDTLPTVGAAIQSTNLGLIPQSTKIIAVSGPITGNITSGSPTVTNLSSTTGLMVGQPVAGLGIAEGTTISAINTAASSMTLSANATATTTAVVLTPGGNISVTATTAKSTALTVISNMAGLVVGQPISGGTIPANTIITAINVAASSLTLSNAATAATKDVPITIGSGTITMSANATAKAAASIILPSDSNDVMPYDPGTAALAAAGPSTVSTSGNPAVDQGFFDTAGAGTSSGSVPAGLAFARSFSQVLAVLYLNTTTSAGSGGFFPVGAGGTITLV